MTKAIAITITLVALLSLASPAHGEEQRPWTHPDVLRAAWEIGLTSQQQPEFRAAVTEFLQGFGADARRLLNSTNQVDLRRRIASMRRSHVRGMDGRMTELLSADQQPAYEAYRDLLLEKMDESAARRRGR